MLITCVCGNGMGSSLIAKMNIESILSKRGISAEVDNCDLGSVSSGSDWYVTTRELADVLPDEVRDRTIILSDFISMDKIESALMEHLE